jgi:hypothetical protein
MANGNGEPGMNITSGSSIINNGTSQLNRSVAGIESQFISEFRKELATLDTKAGGVLSNSKRNNKLLTEMRKRIRKILKKVKYFDFVQEFLTDFDSLQNYQQFINKRENDITLKKSFLNPYKKWATDKVLFDLNRQGLDAKLIQPIKDELRKAINLGGNFVDMITNVENTLRTTNTLGLLRSTVFQASRDSLGQFNGIVNQAVKEAFDLNAIRYVGNIITDTRPQCIRWVGMRTIMDDELQSEINWANRNGTGFIPDTTVDNFLQNRGGYNCRHTAIPVRRENKK